MGCGIFPRPPPKTARSGFHLIVVNHRFKLRCVDFHRGEGVDGVGLVLVGLVGLVGLVAAVFAGPVIDADVVVPVGVHPAVVAVAERTSTEGLLARAWHLHDTGALVQDGRAVVLVVVVAAVVALVRGRDPVLGLGLNLSELAFNGRDGCSADLLHKDGGVGCDEEGSEESEGFHLVSV